MGVQKFEEWLHTCLVVQHVQAHKQGFPPLQPIFPGERKRNGFAISRCNLVLLPLYSFARFVDRNTPAAPELALPGVLHPVFTHPPMKLLNIRTLKHPVDDSGKDQASEMGDIP